MDAFITALLIVFLFALLASGLWIGLSLLGVAWIGMQLFTSRPVGDANMEQSSDAAEESRSQPPNRPVSTAISISRA